MKDRDMLALAALLLSSVRSVPKAEGEASHPVLVGSYSDWLAMRDAKLLRLAASHS